MPAGSSTGSTWIRRKTPIQRDYNNSRRWLLAPMAVIWVAFLMLPIIEAVWYSLTNWDGFTAQWVGLGNYAALFQNSTFWTVIGNNLILLLSVPVAVFLPLVFALLINARPPGWKIFRTFIFLPATLSWVVIGIVAVHVFTQDGMLNELLRPFGAHLDLLGSVHTAIIPIVLTFIYSQVGPNTLIFLIGLAQLDHSVTEAALVDGAGPVQLFYYITLPLLRRFVLFVVSTTLIAAFTALFSLIFVMTGGGPGFGTTTLEFFIYRRAFNQGDFGSAAALGIILFVLVGAVVFTLMRVVRYEED